MPFNEEEETLSWPESLSRKFLDYDIHSIRSLEFDDDIRLISGKDVTVVKNYSRYMLVEGDEGEFLVLLPEDFDDKVNEGERCRLYWDNYNGDRFAIRAFSPGFAYEVLQYDDDLDGEAQLEMLETVQNDPIGYRQIRILGNPVRKPGGKSKLIPYTSTLRNRVDNIIQRIPEERSDLSDELSACFENSMRFGKLGDENSQNKTQIECALITAILRKDEPDMEYLTAEKLRDLFPSAHVEEAENFAEDGARPANILIAGANWKQVFAALKNAGLDGKPFELGGLGSSEYIFGEAGTGCGLIARCLTETMSVRQRLFFKHCDRVERPARGNSVMYGMSQMLCDRTLHDDFLRGLPVDLSKAQMILHADSIEGLKDYPQVTECIDITVSFS